MGKILLVTEKPNNQASTLNHEELFDISKNSFSQFIGRLLLGDETNYRKFFNNSNFTWMHARGSMCHGDKKNDGKNAIYNQVTKENYQLIVTVGAYAMKVFVKNEFTYFDNIIPKMKNGPVKISSINNLIDEKITFINKDCSLVCLPHPSGQNQGMWMNHAEELSDCLKEVQHIIIDIIRCNQLEEDKNACN